MTIDNVEFSEDLETILDELVRELRANGIQLIQKMKPTTTHVQICCPYHNGGLESNPSMGVRRSDGLAHCFACNEVHSLPEIISWCFGRDDGGVFGWSWLLKNFSSMGVKYRKPIDLDIQRGKKQNLQTPVYVTEEELDKYRYTHPYWAKRKITDEKIIELFDLGYDRETDCITMPVKDINGNCVFVARRSVKYKYFNYPKGVVKPVYGLYELSTQIKAKKTIDEYYGDEYVTTIHEGQYLAFYNEIIICESMIDALTCLQYGKPAVALNGLGTQLQFQQLNQFPCRKYIIATDMDNAGQAARAKIKRALKSKLVTEYKWDLSIAKDINDMELPYFQALKEYY